VTLLPKGCDRPALGSREAEIRTGSSWFGENRWESEQAQRVWQAGQDSGSGNQIVTHFEVYPERPADSTLLLPLDRGAPTEVGRNPAPGGRRCEVLFARAKKPDKRWGCGGCRCPTRKLPVANTSFFNTSVGFVAGKSGKPAPGEESACSNWFGRHAAMGRAGRDGGRFHPDGGYLARQNTNWLSPLASRTRMDTRKIATEDYIRSVQCYLAYVRKCIFATESS
jgi:hypothetical protein